MDNSVRIAGDDTTGITAPAQYIIRSPFSLAKLSYNPDTGMVVYRSKMTCGKNKKNFSVSSAAEFIAAITQHIPEKSFQLVRYYGWYSNRMRGERRKDESAAKENGEPPLDGQLEVIDIAGYKPRRIPPPVWRECIKKIWEIDPLECPQCKAEMKIISFINERPVIKKILEHLKLWEKPQRQRPPPRTGPKPPLKQEGLCRDGFQYEFFDDGRPGYEEPYITYD